MNVELRARLRELCDSALPGPWETVYDEDFDEVSIRAVKPSGVSPNSYIEVAETTQWPQDESTSPTAEFIAAAREAIPALLDTLAAIESQATRWAGQSNDYDEDTEQQIADGCALLTILNGGES